MTRILLLAVVIAAAAMSAPSMLQSIVNSKTGSNGSTTTQVLSDGDGSEVHTWKKKKPKKRISKPAKNGWQETIFSDSRGHFQANAEMDGVDVKVLIDTGATGVAINRSTARRIGISVSSSDFKHKANTANGIVKFAQAYIGTIRIGDVQVEHVRAAILPDRSLQGKALLGMSFLNKLDRFEVSQGKMTLVE